MTRIRIAFADDGLYGAAHGVDVDSSCGLDAGGFETGVCTGGGGLMSDETTMVGELGLAGTVMLEVREEVDRLRGV
jgi:hypothetical protein